MDTAAEIKKALILALGANPNLPLTATVVSVENDTCTVKLLSELVLSDVRLKATISEDEDSFLMTPKVGSEVILMSQTGALSGLMVVKVDAIDKIQYKKGDFEFLIDGETGKVTLKNEDVDFGSLMSDFINLIKSLIIQTPVGPGTVAPTSKTQLDQLSDKFKSILNSN